MFLISRSKLRLNFLISVFKFSDIRLPVFQCHLVDGHELCTYVSELVNRCWGPQQVRVFTPKSLAEVERAQKKF